MHRRTLDQIEHGCIQSLITHSGATLEELWRDVCGSLNRIADFRALNMVYAHVEDLMKRGVVVQMDGLRYGVLGTIERQERG